MTVFYEVWENGKMKCSGNVKTIVKQLNISVPTFYRWLGDDRFHNYAFFDVTDEIEFSVYQGELLVFVGTKAEIMEHFNIGIAGFKMMLFRTKQDLKNGITAPRGRRVYLTDERVAACY